MKIEAPIVNLTDVALRYPIYSHNSRSLKKSIFNLLQWKTDHHLSAEKKYVEALKGLNLSFYRGEKIGLWGSNGSGKTTLLRLLAGIYEPTSGSIYVKGHVSALTDLGCGVDPEATGRENIRLRAALFNISRNHLEKIEGEIVKFSELKEFIDLPVKSYSSGMRMRLLFSFIAFLEHQIIVLDEWLSVGDVEFQKKAEAKINELVKQVDLLVLASHNSKLICDVCDRLIVLEGGAIKYDGPPSQYFDIN